MPEKIDNYYFLELHNGLSQEDKGLSILELERELFALALVENELISEPFYTSGALDVFDIDKVRGGDALIHILVGNKYSGGHHLPTIVNLDMEGRFIGSKIYSNNKNNSLPKLRTKQKVNSNGVYRALQFSMISNVGDLKTKHRGSTMFPNEWTTQEVLESIIEISKSNKMYDYYRDVYSHDGEVRGVKLRVITDERTGKIIKAWPSNTGS